jgi:hypothetical protein
LVVSFLFVYLHRTIKQTKMLTKQTPKTRFEEAVQKVMSGELKAPNVVANGRQVPYFRFQLATHHFNLKLMARGMCFKGIKFTDIKNYYGLKGRSAKDCLPQFEELMNKYFKDVAESN